MALRVESAGDEEALVQELIGLSGTAYRLALHFVGSPHEAEDVVQQAYLEALAQIRRHPLPVGRAWFLKIVSNLSRDRLKSEVRRKRREKTVGEERRLVVRGSSEDGDLRKLLRMGLATLDAQYRVPLALSYQEEMSQSEIAEVLSMPASTVSKYVKRGLEKLRRALERAGYPAAIVAVLGGLKETAPVVPASLAPRVEALVTQGAMKTGVDAATTTSAVAKGGIAMKAIAGALVAGALAGAVAVSTGALRGHRNGPPASPGLPEVKENPVTKPAPRENVFEFAQKPSVKKQGERFVISFASKGKCDATVAIVDGKGRIVRHLASGVLGANTPWPFKQDSLSQSIEWDGKTDTGKPAPAGCKVRVGLGLKASYGTTLAYAPHHFYPFGVACDREGNAYVMIPERLAQDHNIRVFSRDGEYVRTILPQPGGLDPKEYAAAFDVHGPAEAPFLIDKPDRIGNFVRGMGMRISSGGLLVFSDGGYRVKKYLYSIRTDGTGLTRGPQLGPWQMVVGRTFLAFTKDETALYVSGQRKHKEAYHCVFKFGLKDETPKEWRGHGWGEKIPVFVGERDKPGNDNAHFNDPRGVATDSDGNLYVCDYGNNRVQVFDSNAKSLRSIPIERPDQVQVHRKTGAVYVLTTELVKWNMKKSPTASHIVKFSPEGRQLAAFDFPGCFTGNAGWTTHFALDDSAEPAVLWIGNPEELWSSGKGLWRVADRGASFEKLGDVAQLESWDPWRDSTSEYISVDPEDKWLYMKNVRLGGYANSLARFDVTTGKREEKWSVTGKIDEKKRLPTGQLPNKIDEPFVGPDGLLYIRGCVPSTKGDPEYIWRVDPETGREVPFPAAEGGRIQYPGWHSAKFHRDGFSVGPNGDVYVIWHVNSQHSKFKIDAWRGGPLILHHYGSDGKLKREDILPGIPYGSCGVQADRAGNIYTGLLASPADKPYPELIWNLSEAIESFKRRSRSVSTTIGTLCKFGPEGGKIERGKDGGWSGKWGRERGAITGLKARYVGIGKFGKGCVCRTCRFDLDGFDRVFAPVADLACVMVLDANFNRIARVGRYGDADNRGPESSAPEPEIALFRPSYVTVNDRSLYIADRGNLRVLKTTLGYHAEETLPLP